MLMTLTKYAYTQLTETEVYIMEHALEEFKPKYPKYDEQPSYQELMKKMSPKKASKVLDKFRESPKQDTYTYLRDFFKMYREVINSNVNAPYNHNNLRMKLHEKQPEVLIGALKNYIKNGDKESKWCINKYTDKWNRKLEFTIDIWRKDVEDLIEGMEEMRMVLKSRWINEVDNLP